MFRKKRYYVITYLRALECTHYLNTFLLSAHVAMDNFLPTLKPPAAPYVIMESFSNKSADLLNVVNKNRKLASLQDGTVLSSPRILKAFLLTNIRNVRRQITARVVINKWFICGKCFFGYNFHGKKYDIHRLGKLSVNFQKRGILLKFSRVFRS